MVKRSEVRRYVVMSADGFLDPVLAERNYQPSTALVTLAARPATNTANPEMRILDSIREDGPKLVEMTAEGELSLRLANPSLKIVQEVFYHRQWEQLHVERKLSAAKARTARATPRRGAKKAAKKSAKAAPSPVTAVITIIDAADGSPVAGARIVAFTNFSAREGAEATSGAKGTARLSGLSPGRTLERVYVYPPAGYWGCFVTDTTASRLGTTKLSKVDVTDPSLLLQELYGALPPNSGAGVTVAIIDSGVDGSHPDLPNVIGGLNCVSEETRNNPAAESQWRPAHIKGEHGTHVAGIVAGRGRPGGFHGVAPQANLLSYRVFPDSGAGASNFDIAKAIDRAVLDKCDIINLSLGGGPRDDLTHAAILRALDAGVVVVAAAGNGYRARVSYPAEWPECVAVSAMGRIGTFPKVSLGTADIEPPKGKPPASKDFVSAFSNFGDSIDVTGPGVEIVSTLPGGSHGPLSGTSMAAPAVAGFAAFLLSEQAGLRQKSGPDRSRALKDALYASCEPRGFGRNFEGFGLPVFRPQLPNA